MLVSKYKLLIYFLPIIVLSSCEGVMSDVLVEPETSKSQVLLFDTYVEKNNVGHTMKSADYFFSSRAGSSIKNNPHQDDDLFYGSIDNIIKLREAGFGVFAYYTNNNDYVSGQYKPNFMWNTGMYWNGDDMEKNSAGQTPLWLYEPVKFWPNEVGNNSGSSEKDKVTFFAYAPYCKKSMLRGETSGGKISTGNTDGIMSITANNSQTDPKICYRVPQRVTESIDLLWGVCPSDGSYTDANEDVISLRGGYPNMNFSKQKTNQNVMFKFKHALSRFNATITGDFDQDAGSGKTMITLKSVKVRMRLPREAVLNLNNIYYNQPNWETDSYVYDDSDELMSEEMISYEADISKDIAYVDYGANPDLWATVFNGGLGGVRSGVTKPVLKTKLNDNIGQDAYYTVIPNTDDAVTNTQITITVVYNTTTVDPRLVTTGGYFSNDQTVTASYAMSKVRAGKAYTLNITLTRKGMSFDVSSEDWADPIVFSTGIDSWKDREENIDLDEEIE